MQLYTGLIQSLPNFGQWQPNTLLSLSITHQIHLLELLQLMSYPEPGGNNRVFITEDYGKGGIMLNFDSNFQPRVLWSSPDFGCQFQTPIYHDGILYGFGGNGGLMLAYDALTGARPGACSQAVPVDGNT